MIDKWLKTALLGCLAVLLIQCIPTDAANTPAYSSTPATDDLPKLETQTAPATPDKPNSINNTQTQAVTDTPNKPNAMNDTQTPPPEPPPADPGLQSLIDKAKEDLAQRLSISLTQISLVEAKNVVWPDTSLGCPQPGMQYAQKLTAGYLIVLATNGQEYQYHASRNTILYCINPLPPVSGTPIDQ